MHTLRIISGCRRGCKLKPPAGIETRPTTDRVKESVFNLLQPWLPADSVLDLFAGSGALGIEALSRGAKQAVFVDRSKTAVQLIRENLDHARLAEGAAVQHMDALAYLAGCGLAFDIIFLDPPYNCGLIAPVLAKIQERGLLHPDGVIVLETEAGGEDAGSAFHILKAAKYGKTAVTLLEAYSR